MSTQSSGTSSNVGVNIKSFSEVLRTQSWAGRKYVLAVSGGLDSMVLAELFFRNGCDIIIAHIDHSLRGEESSTDAQFVKQWAANRSIPFRIKKLNANQLTARGVNLQNAARKERYNFLEACRENENCDFIATAHHEDDQLETVIFHVLRGSGIRGLRGIPIQRDKVIRPLLGFSREELELFASEHSLQWREDSSNSSLKYERNKIRLQLIPKLMEHSPQLRNVILVESRAIQNEFEELSILTEEWKTRHRRLRNDLAIYNSAGVGLMSKHRILAEECLQEYGFFGSLVDEAIALQGTGSFVESGTHRLFYDRGDWVIEPFTDPVIEEKLFMSLNDLYRNFELIKAEVSELSFSSDHSKAYLDEDKLHFPLSLRGWKQGDRFTPLGMKGSMLLSDYFTQKKYSIPEKKRVKLLCRGEEVLWVIGDRSSEKIKISDNTKRAVSIKERDPN